MYGELGSELYPNEECKATGAVCIAIGMFFLLLFILLQYA